MKFLSYIILCLGLFDNLLAHGRSDEMIEMLNTPVPEWMFIAIPIKAEFVQDIGPTEVSFRPRSGGATNSRNRIQIPERGIEFEVDYSIDWSGNNAEGQGVSLSPDKTKLLVNSGTNTHLYEITSSGEHREIPIQLPYITYDDGLKGFITGWSWVSTNLLVGDAEITDERGHDLIENRFYLFHLNEHALARIDLSDLELSDTSGLEIAGIGDNLQHLRLRAGEREFLVKADLKSPPKPLSESDLETSRNHVENNQTDSFEQSLSWLVIGMILVVIFVFSLMLIKRKQK